jgi:hypothetical protein
MKITLDIEPDMEADKEVRKKRFLRTQKILMRTIIILSITMMLLVAWGCLSIHQRSMYDINNNNCLDMSSSMVKWCAKHGIAAKLMYGHRFVNTTTLGQSGLINQSVKEAHAWVQLFGWLDFESTTLFPCNNSYYWTVDCYQTYNVTSGSWNYTKNNTTLMSE